MMRQLRSGFTLIAAVFIMLIMILLALTLATYISSDAMIASKNYFSQKAFYIASAGMEYYIKQLDDDSDWRTPPAEKSKDFGGGHFVITTTNESVNDIIFYVTGLYTVEGETYRRVIEPMILRSGGGLSAILSEYLVYWGGGSGMDSEIKNNAVIIGDIFLNTDLTISNNVVISGDAYSTSDIGIGTNVTITGTLEIGVELPSNPPTLDTTPYDNQIAIAAAYPAGNESYNSQAFTGTTYVNGDVTFNNNANITITGSATIVATGKVTVRQNVSFGDNLTIIAGGKVDIANNVDIGESGLWYSGTEIEVGNNAEVGEVGVGEGTVFITPGDIDFGNNIEYYGFIYCGGDFVQTGNNFYFEGNMIVGGGMVVDNNTTMQLNPDLFSIEDLVGIIGGGGAGSLDNIDVTSWDEVY
ncbi:MAG: hypothetical protein JW782_01705 [Candidatus Saganbacteria bacterium]|nr:hypothetical protein [Candidatus Saganbacteria bacterium]